jgi:hypothetical protein
MLLDGVFRAGHAACSTRRLTETVMPKANAKVKATRSSKQAKQKLVAMMRDLEKTTKQPASKASRGSCARIYCI